MHSPTNRLVLQVRDLAFRYPDRPDPLFTDLSAALYAGDRLALVGANGAGKSTLLRLFAGELEPEGGRLMRSGQVALVPQDDRRALRGSVAEALLTPYPRLAGLYADIVRQERSGLPRPLDYADRMQAFGEEGGFELLRRLEQELGALGFPAATLERPAEALSGGERRLLVLLSALTRPSDLLLLDEPTNDLDERATEALVERLRSHPAACVLISHDRWLIDRIATGVLELDRGRATLYRGNYSTYREAREADRKRRERTRDRLESEIGRLREMERSYKVWGERKEGEKSGAMDKGFIGARAARLMKRGVLARERISARIERLEQARPWIDKRRAVAFEGVSLPQGTCVSVSGLSFGHDGRPLLAGVSLTLAWGERVAVVGDNGTGKSTLLRLLLGELEPQAGEICWAPGVRRSYLPQLPTFPAGATLASQLVGADPARMRTLLGAFGMGGDAWGRPLTTLSEGQQRKVALARLLLTRPDVLLLDEPSSHLDLASVEMIEAALHDFRGSLLLVTHDRYLRERLTTRQLRLGAPAAERRERDRGGGARRPRLET